MKDLMTCGYTQNTGSLDVWMPSKCEIRGVIPTLNINGFTHIRLFHLPLINISKLITLYLLSCLIYLTARLFYQSQTKMFLLFIALIVSVFMTRTFGTAIVKENAANVVSLHIENANNPSGFRNGRIPTIESN